MAKQGRSGPNRAIQGFRSPGFALFPFDVTIDPTPGKIGPHTQQAPWARWRSLIVVAGVAAAIDRSREAEHLFRGLNLLVNHAGQDAADQERLQVTAAILERLRGFVPIPLQPQGKRQVRDGIQGQNPQLPSETTVKPVDQLGAEPFPSMSFTRWQAWTSGSS